MKNILLTIISISYFYSIAWSQNISPSGVYGAAYSGTSGGLSINWILGSITPTSISVLPVKLISFKGSLTSAGDAKLEWRTAQEVNNKGFEIQKSLDARSFEDIGWIDAAGDSEVEKAYEFIDKSLETTSYYRLKQVDFDDHFTISRMVTVIPENESLERFAAFPNPSPNGILDVISPEKAVSLTLIDHRGFVIQQQAHPVDRQQITLPLPGLYLLRIKTAVGEKTLKLVRE